MPAIVPLPLRRSRARTLGALALALSLSACDRAGGEVVLGMAAPLSETYGAEAKMGADLAAAQLAAEGHPVRLVAMDDGADPGRAITVADSLGAAEVVAVVGHVNSGTTIAAAPTYALAGLPIVATSATSPDVSGLGDHVFRVASSDLANARQLAAHARRRGQDVGILYSNDDYGRGLAGSFAAAFQTAGGRVVSRDPYLDDTPDLRPYLLRLRQRGATVVFLAGLDEAAARIIDQSREVGLAVRFVGGDGLEGLRSRGAAYEGTEVGVLFHRDASPAARAFAQAYEARYGRPPSSYAATAYDAVRVLARAAQEGGNTREGIRRALARIGAEGGTPAYAGASGTLRFDPNGDPKDKEFAVGTIRNGTIQLNDGDAR